eukprot:CAMPEP_0185759950 /NCGR_PEP_ID=MMETSP1174-20130828/18763_1 /TAXON_ID=35687 /ORGANISM="Dictyocha speculum, Strain CCMP1381" /LENGTH=67 /DNA_ID=CAMNT_0028440537 /DNA_START=179 /DNA_END=382 /DNA_ORIENTATION=+
MVTGQDLRSGRICVCQRLMDSPIEFEARLHLARTQRPAVLSCEEREADERTDSIYVRWAARIDVTSP